MSDSSDMWTRQPQKAKQGGFAPLILHLCLGLHMYVYPSVYLGCLKLS